MTRLFCLAAVILLASPLSADENDAHKTRRSLIRQLAGRNPAKRIEALQKLATLPGLDSAKMALRSARDFSPEVRQQTRRTLTHLASDGAVAEYLLDQFERQARSAKANVSALVLLAALCSVESDPLHQKLITLLDEDYAGANRLNRSLIRIADQIGPQADESLLETIAVLSRTKAFEESFLFRRILVQALTRVPRRRSVEALIALTPRLKGEVWSDVVPFLRLATGKPFGASAAEWQSWWKGHGPSFEMPTPEEIAAKVQREQLAGGQMQLDDDEGLARYYGFPLYAKRLVFVMDVSRSMRGRKLIAAKTELTEAIQNLPPDTRFSVVVFHRSVAVWRRSLIPASVEAKGQAAQFVARLDAQDKTATYDALDAAFRFDAEAVFLLTDGVPSHGRIVQPKQILKVVTQENRARRITINVIGIQPNGGFAQFLQELAGRNFGRFRRVD